MKLVKTGPDEWSFAIDEQEAKSLRVVGLVWCGAIILIIVIIIIGHLLGA